MLGNGDSPHVVLLLIVLFSDFSSDDSGRARCRRNSVLPVPSPADMVTTFCSIFDTARTSRNLVPFLLRQPVVAIVTMPAGEGTGSTGLGTGIT